MNKIDSDIIKTLNILIYLKDSIKINHNNFELLQIKTDYLNNENLTIGDFINSLKLLSQNLYILFFVFFDKDILKEINKEYKKKDNIELEKINKIAYEYMDKNKKRIYEELSKTYNAFSKNIEIDKEEWIIFLENFRKNFSEKIIAYVYIIPDKNINNLLNKMNNGESFSYIIGLKLGLNALASELLIKEYKLHLKQNFPYAQILKHMFDNGKEKQYDIENDFIFKGYPNIKYKKIYDSCMAFNKRVYNKTKKTVKKFFVIENGFISLNKDIL